MNIKYLPMKFTLVALLVALCLGSLYTNGLKYGRDIAGGYEAQYEVKNEEGDSTLVVRIVEVLKRRLDPSGLGGIVLTPMRESNRIAISMPAPSKASKDLQRLFLAARANLLATNISVGDLYTLGQIPAKDRQAAILKRCTDNTEQAKRVSDCLAAHAAQTAANAELVKARIAANAAKVSDPKFITLTQAVKAKDQAVNQANSAYRQMFTTLRKGNINPLLLLNIFKLYDESQFSDAHLPGEKAKDAYDTAIAKLALAHPGQKALLDATLESYTKWVKIRKPLEDPADLKRMIRNIGQLTFRIAPVSPSSSSKSGLTDADVRRFEENLELNGPDDLRNSGADYAWYPVREDVTVGRLVSYNYAGKTYVLLSNIRSERFVHESTAAAAGTDWELTSASPGSDGEGGPAVLFNFDARGGRLMGDLTSSNRGRQMAILLDDEMYSAPNIAATITDRGIITGNFTKKEVLSLCRTLNAGRMPGKIYPEPVSEEVYGAEIGGANLVKGVNSAIYGLVIVACFMLVYYLFMGLVANAALMLNMALVLGAMSLFQVELSLPGIAGLILTIGMAVDANVLIFERFREEQDRGLGVAMAIKNAYEQAFSAIFDANVTTLLVCGFLYYVLEMVGMQPVRGFAITLGLGVMFSMFTSLVVTRWSFAAMTQMGLLKGQIKMLRVFPKFNVNWMTKRYLFWVVSLVFMTAGLISLVSVGGKVFGVEFAAGAKVTLAFNDDVLLDGKLPTDAIIRDRLLGKTDGAVQTYLAKINTQLTAARPTVEAELKVLQTKAAAVKTKLDAAKAAHDKAAAAEPKVKPEDLAVLSQRLSDFENQANELATAIGAGQSRIAALEKDVASCKELAEARVTTVYNDLFARDFIASYAANNANVVTAEAWAAADKDKAWFALADTNKDSKLDTDELQTLADNHPVSYRVSTTVTNAPLIRRVLTHAFGEALKRRPACTFDIVVGKPIPALNVSASATGVTFVTAAIQDTLDKKFGIQDYTIDTDAAVLVVDKVSPALTVADMKKRIHDIRLQPDFSAYSMNNYSVISLDSAAGKGYSSFLVLVKPAGAESLNAAAKTEFAKGERSVLAESLLREEAMVASVHDAAYAETTVQLTIVVIVMSWLAIVIYLWLRFGSLQWGLAAVACLVHDVVIVVGLVAASHWVSGTSFGNALGIGVFKIDLAMVAAVLTVIGYSVNDTIVVFDRIRENRGKRTHVTSQCINNSINQTLPRTVLTSFTTLVVVLCMYILGGDVIKSYSFALIAGILFGTYSSVAVASPLLMGFRHALVGDMSDANEKPDA